MMTGRSNPLFDEAKQAAQRERNTYQIGLWNGVLFTLIAIVSTISTIQTGLNVFGGIALTVVVAGVSFLAASLARHGQARTGGIILVGTILLTSLTLPVVAKGQSLPLAALSFIVTSTIAYFTLAPRWAMFASIASLLIGLLIILADFFLPDFGIPNDPQVTTVISAVAGAIYLIALARRFADFSLRAKLLTAFLLITLLPILALSIYTNTVTRSILTEEAEASLGALAAETGLSIDQFTTSQLDIIKMEAQQPVLLEFLRQNQFNPDARLEAASLKTLLTFIRKNPVFIQSYALLDMNGKVLLSTNPSQKGTNEGRTDYFRLVLLQQKPANGDQHSLEQCAGIVLHCPGARRKRHDCGSAARRIQCHSAAISGEHQSHPGAAGQRVVLVEKASLLRLADTQHPG